MNNNNKQAVTKTKLNINTVEEVLHSHTCDWLARCIPRTNLVSDALIGQEWAGSGLKSKWSPTEAVDSKQIFSQSISLTNSWQMAVAFLTNYTQIIALKSYLQHKQLRITQCTDRPPPSRLRRKKASSPLMNFLLCSRLWVRKLLVPVPGPR